MLFKNFAVTAASLLLCSSTTLASLGSRFHTHDKAPQHQKHAKRAYLPKPATGYKTVTGPQGVKLRYKEPGKEGVCETTPGVGSYSGYIDVAPNVHMFFWFFESRNDPANDPLTLWLNGGPGSDSLIGMFQELGPCMVTENLTTRINPYSWNNVSNLLFLSQPVGTGFSYQGIANGSISPYVDTYLNSSQANVTGTFPILDPVDLGTIDTTDLAAIGAWHALQGFLGGMSSLNGDLKGVKDFNLWTESYGGHYGPAFYHYFEEQNAKISSGKMKGYALNMATLGIGNGIIDEAVQAEWYPEFAVNNTYGIKAYNDTVYSYAKFANFMLNGCLSQIEGCVYASSLVNGGNVPNGYKNNGSAITYKATSEPAIATLCSEAADMCRDNVESPYYYYGGRGVYDIRHPIEDPTPPEFFVDYLNQADVQEAIGVSVNYTESNTDIYWHFQSTGDFIYPNFLSDLEDVIDSGVRVSLYYGDADYICNWFGGQAISLALDFKNKAEFAAQGYAPMKWGGVEYGETREYGNFSFTRIYEAGHEVPFYQPAAMLALFDRAINFYDIPSGTKKVTGSLGSGSNYPSSATHTEAAPHLPSFSGSVAPSSYVNSLLSSYSHRDNLEAPTSGPIPTATSS